MNFVSNELIIRRNNYKLHTHIHYNYSVHVMRNIKKNLEKYYRIKVDIKCVFLFVLNSKTKYTSQAPTISHIFYETHKFTTFDLIIKITIVTQYKMQALPSLVVANSYKLGLDEITMLELGRCCQKIEGKRHRFLSMCI